MIIFISIWLYLIVGLIIVVCLGRFSNELDEDPGRIHPGVVAAIVLLWPLGILILPVFVVIGIGKLIEKLTGKEVGI